MRPFVVCVRLDEASSARKPVGSRRLVMPGKPAGNRFNRTLNALSPALILSQPC